MTSASGKCRAQNPKNCYRHGTGVNAAIKNQDINAFLDAKETEDNTNSMTDFFTTQQELRSNPPHVVSVKSGDGWQILMDEEGNVFEKQYDDYGAGVGSRKLGPVGKLIYSKDIKKAVASAWEQKDKNDAFKALPKWKQEKIKFHEALEVYKEFNTWANYEVTVPDRLEPARKAWEEYYEANPDVDVNALRLAYYSGNEGMWAYRDKYSFPWLEEERKIEKKRHADEAQVAADIVKRNLGNKYNDSRR